MIAFRGGDGGVEDMKFHPGSPARAFIAVIPTNAIHPTPRSPTPPPCRANALKHSMLWAQGEKLKDVPIAALIDFVTEHYRSMTFTLVGYSQAK